MITETQRKLLNRMIEAVERDALEGERGISIEEGQRAKRLTVLHDTRGSEVREVSVEVTELRGLIQENMPLATPVMLPVSVKPMSMLDAEKPVTPESALDREIREQPAKGKDSILAYLEKQAGTMQGVAVLAFDARAIDQSVKDRGKSEG